MTGTDKSRLKRNSNFPFLNRELFYVLNVKTGRPKKMPYVREFATSDLS